MADDLIPALVARVAELEDPENFKCSDCGATYTQTQLDADRADAAEARVAELEAAQSVRVRELAELARETGLLRHRAADLGQRSDGLMARMEDEMRRQAARADDYAARLKATNGDYIALSRKLDARIDYLTDELVDAWHEGHRTAEPLNVVLGMTDEQCAERVEGRPARPEVASGPASGLEVGSATDAMAMAREFHVHLGDRLPDRLVPPGPDTAWRLDGIILPEVAELVAAWAGRDPVEIAGELADVVDACHSTAAVLGIPLDAVIAEVHRANMTKDPAPDGGKAIKGARFMPADVASIVAPAVRIPERCPACDDDEGPDR